MLRQNNLIQSSLSAISRHRSKKKTKLVWKILVLTIICGDALFLTGAIVDHVFDKWVTTHQTISPTEIPWIKTREECVHTDRVWQNEQCLDTEHSHLF